MTFIRFNVWLWLLLTLPLCLWAQDEVQLGGHRFVPPQNMEGNVRGRDADVAALKGLKNVLVQFKQIPNAEAIAKLRAAGLELGSYVGGNAYYAALSGDARVVSQVRRLHLLTSMVAMRPEWKLHTALSGAELPTWATTGGNVKVVVRFAPNAPRATIVAALQELGATAIHLSTLFDQVEVTASRSQINAIAALPWVLAINPIDRPSTLFNDGGAKLGRAQILRQPTSMGGRGLSGAGRKVGIWDGNVIYHPDFANRVHVQEYESADGNEEHGTHVAGTVLGAGLLNAKARGMAPKAEAWTYNFNVSSNGLSEREEMALARERFGIHATQNSYGLAIGGLCDQLKELVYFNSEYQIDALANKYPTLTHVYAAGNDQFRCTEETRELWGVEGYGTTSRKAKNIITVGAVDDYGFIASFSSWGPTDDGRLFPLLCAKGVQVYSTQPKSKYAFLDGTSMACPTVTGHALLLQERYAQLYHGEEMRSDLVRALLANTADDAGTEGPDFKYGYGVMNAEKAILALEREFFTFGEVETGKSFTKEITLPAGTQEARVMLVWNDPASERDYQWGQSVLINDLDLRVAVAGKEYQPWVLKPEKGKVELPAERANDRLNNVEQVTLTSTELAGATNISITVKGTRITDGKQAFAIVWWADGKPEARIVAPAAGEVYAIGETTVGILEAVEAPYVVEISYDGGKNYNYLGKVAGQYLQMSYRIPEGAPNTNQAKMRIIDKMGRTAVSTGLFTISEKIENLELTTGDCGLAGWKLTWDKAKAANVEYEILLADRSKGTWHSIGHTAETEFVIPEANFHAGEQPSFCVAIRFGDNQWGVRSEAITATVPMPLKLQPTDLPFAETFRQEGSDYFKITGGKYTSIFYRNVSYQQTPGSNVLYYGVVGVGTFDESAWFDKGKNGDFISDLTLCNVDLTSFAADQQVQLHIRGGLARNTVSELTTSRFRVLDNGKPLPNSYGKEVVETTQNGLDDYYYLLQGGTTHKLVIQHCGMKPRDFLTLNGIWIEALDQNPDVSVALARKVSDSINMGVTFFPFAVKNVSSRPVDKVELRVYLNDKWVTSKEVKNLLPKTDQVINVPIDLSTTDPYGARYTIRAEVAMADEKNTKNNTFTFAINNLGKVQTHPSSTYYGGEAMDPRRTIEVDKPILYTDNGGAYSDYLTSQRATLQFIPKDPSMRLRVRFHSVDLVGDSTYLAIYTSKVPATLEMGETPPRDILQGRAENLEFVSDSDDGGLVFFFRTKEEGRAAGWRAEIDLVPMANPLTLLSAKASLRGTKADERVPVQVTIRNNYPTPQKDVNVSLFSPYLASYISDTLISEVKPGITELSLPPVKIKQRFITDCQAVIQANCDTYGQDNNRKTLLAYEKYPIPGLIGVSNPYIFEMIVNDSLFSPNDPWIHVQYETFPTIPVYIDDQKVKVQYSLEFGEDDVPYAIGAWVDWNQNSEFEENEKTSANFDAGESEPVLSIPLPSTLQEGEYRVRMAICPPDALKDGANFPNGFAYGDLRDFTFAVKAKNPTTDDLELLAIDAGDSGENLASNQPISLQLKNRSLHTYDKEITVTVSVDGAPEASETIKVDPAIEAKDNGEIELQGITANLSTPGRHIIKATIAEKPEAVNTANNTTTHIVYCTKHKVDDEQYCMSFQSLVSESDKQSVVLPHVASQLKEFRQGDIYRFEMLFKADHSQPATLLQGKKFAIQLARNSEYGFPNNSIGVVCGDYAFRWTDGNAVTFGQWHHLAVEVAITKMPTEDSSGDTDVRIWIDGKPQKINTYGLDIPNFRALELGKYFNGEIDEFRCMRGKAEDAKILEYINKHYVKSGEDLPANCIAEYSFDEGTGNWASICKGTAAGIEVTDATLVSKTENGIWKKHGELLSQISFDGMVNKQLVGNKWKVKFKKEVAAHKNAINGSLLPNWQGTEFKYKGKTVTENQLFDFTTDVTINATLTLFGKSYNQTLVFEFEADESDARDLLSLGLKKANNAGLTADLDVAQPIPTVCPIVLKRAEFGEPTALNKVKLSFEASPEAQVYVDEVKPANILVNNVTEVDFTRPRVLIVEAKNKETKRYEVSLLREQEITWDNVATNYTYGGAAVTLSATASSSLPVRYEALTPTVASVVDNQLRLGLPGSAVIRCIQNGNEQYTLAQPIEKTIVVAKKPITVMPKLEATVSYGAPIDWKFSYTGLVSEADLAWLKDESAKGAYKLSNAAGVTFALDDLLPAGQYKLQATGAYETERYIITPEEKTFEVVNDKQVEVTFVVKDNDGPLTDVLVTVAKLEGRTNTNGEVRFPLPIGKATGYVASKGSVRIDGSHTPTASGNNKVEITFPKETLTLTYKPDEHSTLSGNTLQKVAVSMSGTDVLVVPAEGYEFVQWSDGRKDNPRRDTQVAQSLEVTAQCKAKLFTIRYTLVGSGKWLQGEQEQMVAYNENASPIAVAPADDESLFERWSDGNVSAEREDKNIKRDAEHTAYFTSYATLPTVQKFDDGTFPKGWYSLSEGAATNPMYVANGLSDKAFVLDNGFLFCDNRNLAINGRNYTTYLYTPRYRTTGLAADLQMHFDYSLRWGFQASRFVIEYTTDGQNWQPWIANIPNSGEGRATFDEILDAALFAGKEFVQFRFVYQPIGGWYLCIDNVNIFEKKTQQYTLSYVSEPAGAGEFIIDDVVVESQTVEHGKAAKLVEAQAKASYRFIGWKGGSTSPKFRAVGSVFADATYTALFAKAENVRVAYTASPAEGGTIVGEAGLPLSYQLLNKGGNAAPVKAVANEGWQFAYWLHNGVAVAELQDNDVQADCERTAVFTRKTTKVNFVVTCDKGTLRDAQLTLGIKTFDLQSDGRLQLELATGEYQYTIGAPHYQSSKGQFVVGAEDVTISVLLKRLPNEYIPLYAITFAQPRNGKLSVLLQGRELTSGYEVEKGTELELQVTPNEGYELESLKAGDDDLTGTVADNKVRYTVQNAVTISAQFKQKATHVNSSEVFSISARPNPFADKLRIINEEQIQGIYRLTNATGVVVRSGKLESHEVVIETADLASGLYLLRITSANGASKTIRVVKE